VGIYDQPDRCPANPAPEKEKIMIFCLETNDNQIIDPRGNPIENVATLTIGRTFDEGFTYAYSQMEFVISEKRNTVDFHLHSHLQDHDVSIATVCCSVRQAILKVEAIPCELMPSGSKEGTRITFSFVPGLLLSMGLVVNIVDLKTPGDPGVLLLCDPQVGSGPP
jgi:hypothetical protein